MGLIQQNIGGRDGEIDVLIGQAHPLPMTVRVCNVAFAHLQLSNVAKESTYQWAVCTVLLMSG